MPVQTDFMVVLEDRPGMAAGVAEALGRAGVNIEGACALTSGGSGLLHLLVDGADAERTRIALEGDGVRIHTVRHVWVAQCPDRPGELGHLLRRLAEADVNCDLVYMTTLGRVVVGAEDLDQVTALLS